MAAAEEEESGVRGTAVVAEEEGTSVRGRAAVVEEASMCAW
jgi:hypothetical protein